MEYPPLKLNCQQPESIIGIFLEITVNLQLVVRHDKVMLLSHTLLQSLDIIVLELHHRVALDADQMIVMLVLVHGLKPLESFAEAVLNHKTALDQNIQSTVNAGNRCGYLFLAKQVLDILYAEMAFRVENYLGDSTALAGNEIAVFPEKS